MSILLIRLNRAEDPPAAVISQAAIVLERLCELEPAEPRHRLQLASLNINRAILHFNQERLQESASFARTAWEQASQLLAEDGEANIDLSSVAFNAAGLLSDTLQTLDQLTEAETVCRRALEECERQVRKRPDDRQLQKHLGKLQGSLGHLLLKAERLPEAEPVLHAALTSLEHSLRYKDSPYALFQAATSDDALMDQYLEPEQIEFHAKAQTALGSVLVKLNRSQEAASQLHEAAFVWELMAQRFKSFEFKYELARTRWLQSDAAKSGDPLQAKSGDPLQAEAYMRRAMELYREFVDLFPKSARYRTDYALVLNSLGCKVAALARLDDARQLFEEGIKHGETALELQPGAPNASQALGMLRANLRELEETPGSASR